MAKFVMGPTGSSIRGHVLDCAVAPLERALKSYDSQLYVHWNPRKLRGWGCWQVRWKPEAKTVREEDIVVFNGNTYVCPQYHENNFNNHVIDVPFLNYDIINKIKKMDAWVHYGYKGKDLGREVDYIEAKYDEKVEDEMIKEREYNLKQMRSEIRWLKEYVASGGNPARIADYWK